mmetsp:Transcript_6162/g.19635  ORF Transcript_6162/g.19635 Transcript_6162/m.19635 type:complete len:204 (+) Transcript_6162:135-746(+)
MSGKPASSPTSLRSLFPAAVYLAASGVHRAAKWFMGASTQTERVSDVLQSRREGRANMYTIQRDESAHRAIQVMNETGVHCLVAVCGRTRAFDGVVTVTDFIREVAVPLRDPLHVQVGQIMTPADRVAFVYPDNTLASAMEVMAAVGSHHLVVMQPECGGLELVATLSMWEILGLTRERLERDRASGLSKVMYASGIKDLGEP